MSSAELLTRQGIVRPDFRRLRLLLLATACAAAWPAFAVGRWSPDHMRTRTPRVRRQFFQNTFVDKTYMDRQFFVASTLHVLLPAAKKGKNMKVVELEPLDGRYMGFLKPGADQRKTMRWFLDEYIAVGNSLWEAGTESELVKKLKKEA
eukprot:s625_g14.t1